MWLLALTELLPSITPTEMHLSNRRSLYSHEILLASASFGWIDDPAVDKQGFLQSHQEGNFSSCYTFSIKVWGFFKLLQENTEDMKFQCRWMT